MLSLLPCYTVTSSIFSPGCSTTEVRRLKTRKIEGLGGRPVFWSPPHEVNEDLGYKRTSALTFHNSVSPWSSGQGDHGTTKSVIYNIQCDLGESPEEGKPFKLAQKATWSSDGCDSSERLTVSGTERFSPESQGRS